MKKFIAAAFAASAVLGLSACADKFEKAGLHVTEEDGRIWVFKEGSDNMKMFEEVGEPAKQYTSIGSGPDGKTVKAADLDVLDQYLELIKK